MTVSNLPTPTFDPFVSDESNRLATQVANQWLTRQLYWKPWHDRQDQWMAMYQLWDVLQNTKPTGMFRFISNDPQTGPNAAHSILTRNHVFWDMDTLAVGDMDAEDRRTAQDIEYSMGGIVDDYDSLFLRRGEGMFWFTAAWQALLRGAICFKGVVTEESGRDDGVPFQGEFIDPRITYPLFDSQGLHSIVFAKRVSLAGLLQDYPDNEHVQRAIAPTGDEYDADLTSPGYKLEWWDFRRKKMTGVLAMWPGQTDSFSMVVGNNSPMLFNGMWVQEPFEHGYDENNRPITITPVNQMPLNELPDVPSNMHIALSERAELSGLRRPSWIGAQGWVSNWGRSILASVEEHVPQYNELVSTILHKFSAQAYGNTVLKTRTGTLPPWEFGAGAVNALRLEESAQQLEVQPVNQDAWRLIALIQQEKERGVISNVLQASTPFGNDASGFLAAQVTDIALNGIDPFKQGLQAFGTQVSRSHMHQLRDSDIDIVELVARSRGNTPIRIAFDTSVLEEREFRLEPRFEPALPADLALKAQTARLLLDPRNPIMSLEDVLERVFRHPDSQGVKDRIFKDIAERDPLIVLMRIAEALKEEGEDDLAERIMETQFRAKFIEDAQFKQAQAALGGGVPGQPPGGQQTTTGAGLGPEAGGTGVPNQVADRTPTEPAGQDNAF